MASWKVEVAELEGQKEAAVVELAGLKEVEAEQGG